MNLKFLRTGLIVLTASLLVSVIVLGKLGNRFNIFPSKASSACVQTGSHACVGNAVTGDCYQGGVNNAYACYKLKGNPGIVVSNNTCSCPSGYPWGPRQEYGKWWCFNTSVICDGIGDYAVRCSLQPEQCSPTPTPTPKKTPTPTPTPTITPTITPTATPTVTPTATPTSTPTSTPTATPTVTPTATPNSCNGTCGSNSNCQNGYFCHDGYCRNPSCQDESDCSCDTPQVLSATAPPILPKTGSNILGIIAGFLGTIGAGVFFFKKFKLI